MSRPETNSAEDHRRLAWLGYSSTGVVTADAWARLIATRRRGGIPRRKALPGQYGWEPGLNGDDIWGHAASQDDDHW
jgi:hypothetical protein